MAAKSNKSPDESSPVLTADDVCALLHIHRTTLYRLLKRRQIPCFHVGSDYRFSREAIDQWRRAQEANQ